MYDLHVRFWNSTANTKLICFAEFRYQEAEKRQRHVVVCGEFREQRGRRHAYPMS
jgi:hypothetical protein